MTPNPNTYDDEPDSSSLYLYAPYLEEPEPEDDDV